jgi:hypothetical protein
VVKMYLSRTQSRSSSPTYTTVCPLNTSLGMASLTLPSR